MCTHKPERNTAVCRAPAKENDHICMGLCSSKTCTPFVWRILDWSHHGRLPHSNARRMSTQIQGPFFEQRSVGCYCWGEAANATFTKETDFEHWLHWLHAFLHKFLQEWEQSTIVHTFVKLENHLSQSVYIYNISETTPERKPATSSNQPSHSTGCLIMIGEWRYIINDTQT